MRQSTFAVQAESEPVYEAWVAGDDYPVCSLRDYDEVLAIAQRKAERVGVYVTITRYTPEHGIREVRTINP